MFHFDKTYADLPESGGRWRMSGGALVEVKGEIIWRGGGNSKRVYRLDKRKNCWHKVTDGPNFGFTLAAHQDELLAVGGWKGIGDGYKSVMAWHEDAKIWIHKSDMLIGCWGSCLLLDGEGGLLVIGWKSDSDKTSNVVQVFDTKTQTWKIAPELPQRCRDISAVVHGDKIIVMGGYGMARSVWHASISELVSINYIHKNFKKKLSICCM